MSDEAAFLAAICASTDNDLHRLVYAAFEGGSFTKVRTPLCLSHHPSSPLTSEEVVARANRS